LELALYAAERRWPGVQNLLDAARRDLGRRPGDPGPDAAADQFERTFHRVAVATLVSGGSLDEAEAYLTAVLGRRGREEPDNGGPPATTGLLFARAWLDEARTEPARDYTSGRIGLPSLMTPSALTRDTLERAAAGYARAVAHPELAGEARVRRAFVLHRLGRQAEALASLPEAIAGDAILEYWRLMIGGRIHEAAGQLGDARDHYSAAATAWPAAQSAAIALTSILARNNQPAEAERWAAAARQRVDPAGDPWWTYWAGDRRWLPVWLAELRSARP
jgi:tetratricopeptide (TPR) repeat protein